MTSTADVTSSYKTKFSTSYTSTPLAGVLSFARHCHGGNPMSRPSSFPGTGINQRKFPAGQSIFGASLVDRYGWYYRRRWVSMGQSHFSSKSKHLVVKLLVFAVIALGTDMVCCGVDGATMGTSLHVPARINSSLSSSNITVQEGRNLTLSCSATGVPAPIVTWRRQSNRNFDYMHRTLTSSAHGGSGPMSAHPCPIGTGLTDEYIGHTLVIQNISRYCNGFYECTAANDVLQPAHHHVHVAVQFKPKVSMLNGRLAQAIDRQVIMECHVTAYPQPEMKWEKDGQRLMNSARYHIYVDYVDEHTMAMQIELPRVIDDSDFGDYKCIAKNNLGSHEGITRLSKLVAPSSDRVVSSSARLGNMASPMVFWIGAPLVVLAIGHRAPDS